LELAERIDDAGAELGVVDGPFDDDGMEVENLVISEEGFREGLELAEGIELPEADETFESKDMDDKDLEPLGDTENFELADELADGREDVPIKLLEDGEVLDDADAEGNELGGTEEGGADGFELTELIDDEPDPTDEAFEDGRLEGKELEPCVLLEEGAAECVEDAADTDEIEL
jgi:hypothetical protein